MVYWFFNLNFNLMFLSSTRGWRKKVKFNKLFLVVLKRWGVVNSKQPLHKKWSFPLRISSVNVTKSAVSCGYGHIYWRNPQWKNSFFVLWTCLTDNRMNIDVKNGTWKFENIQFMMQEWWNDECFLFTYLPSWRMQQNREKILIFCLSYSRQIPVMVLLIFATNFNTASYRVVCYRKTYSLNLVCFIGEWPGSVRYLLQQPWEKWKLHIKDPRGENICTKAVFIVATERCIGNVEWDRQR